MISDVFRLKRLTSDTHFEGPLRPSPAGRRPAGEVDLRRRRLTPRRGASEECGRGGRLDAPAQPPPPTGRRPTYPCPPIEVYLQNQKWQEETLEMLELAPPP